MSHPRSLPALLGLVLLLASTASAVTRTVPNQFPTIQAAINASSAGDTVAVLPGTYVENLVINRAIVLRSTGGPAVTVIDGSTNADSTVKILAGKITGFDIRNGSGTGLGADKVGGGVFADSTATVQGNWIHDNVVSAPRANGGGVYVFGYHRGPAVIRDNRIYNNRIESTLIGQGAGLYATHLFGTPEGLIEGNEIFGNHAENGSAAADGNGVFRHNIVACNSVESSAFGTAASGVKWGSSTVEGNTIVANWSFDLEQIAPAMRIYVSECCPVEVFGNLIAFNIGHGLECRHPDPFGEAHFSCNNIYGNSGDAFTGECGNPMGQDNNISVDPQFGLIDCPYQHGSWCLGPDSPLLPENSPPGCGLIGALGECSQIGIADSPPAAGSLRGGPAVPNPFTQRTTIPFYLAKESAVEIAIVDVLGRQIRRIEPGHMGIGDHTAQWDGRTDEGTRAASGAYIAVIRAGGAEVTQTLLLLR